MAEHRLVDSLRAYIESERHRASRGGDIYDEILRITMRWDGTRTNALEIESNLLRLKVDVELETPNPAQVSAIMFKYGGTTGTIYPRESLRVGVSSLTGYPVIFEVIPAKKLEGLYE